jgi:hypothetical protein
MKKKIIGSFLIIAFAAVAAFNMNLSLEQKNEISLLVLANIEALAQNENSNGCETLSSGSSVVGWLTGCSVPRPSCRQYSYYCLGSGGGSCRPGSSFVYYNCNGEVTSTDDSYRSVAYCKSN